MPAVYGRNKDGSNVYHCSAHRADGELCGNRVQSYGSVCGIHRRQRERERRAASERRFRLGMCVEPYGR